MLNSTTMGGYGQPGRFHNRADTLLLSRYLMAGFILLVVGCGECGAQGPLYYHYFKERRILNLDTNRVAVLQTTQAAPAGPGQSFAKFGLVPEQARALAVPGWSFARPPASTKSESDVRNLVSQMAGSNDFDFVAPVFTGDDGNPVVVTPDILVGFEAGVTEQQADTILAGIRGITILHHHWGNMNGAYHLRTNFRSGLDVLDAANQLAELPEVKFAEPDMIFSGHGGFIPNDPYFADLWGMRNTGQFGGTPGMDMKTTQAWDITTGSPSIIVVIIDVGVQPDHPDLHQIPGTNFTTDASFDGGPVNACDNHGTPVAGCVSAIINNGVGTVGIAPGCVSASARAFIANNACDGSWTAAGSWTVNALAWAQHIGARISNNSNFYGFQSSAIAAEYLATHAAGIVHFACAGNNSANSLSYPASLPGVNAVAALNESGSLASFSNYGTGLAFSAPGQDIYTTDRTGTNGWTSGDYTSAYGTSFASPYAAGVAALVLSINPSLNATNVEQIMKQSCVDLGAPGYDTTYGWGFVNAYNAVILAAQTTGDSVGDGIQNWWRAKYFGGVGTNTNSVCCATCDADGTGQDNLFKYVTGLDPTNPASIFAFEIAGQTNQPTWQNLLFNPEAAGRTYTPLFSTDLVSGVWLPLVGFTGPVTNVNQVTITDTNAVQPQKLYRLQISTP